MTKYEVVDITEELIQTVKDRILEQCQPESIYLFGSTAKGQNKSGSDLDILVVIDLPEGKSRWAQASDLYSAVIDIPIPIDIIVILPEEFEFGIDLPGHGARLAVQEGWKLYD